MIYKTVGMKLISSGSSNSFISTKMDSTQLVIGWWRPFSPGDSLHPCPPMLYAASPIGSKSKPRPLSCFVSIRTASFITAHNHSLLPTRPYNCAGCEFYDIILWYTVDSATVAAAVLHRVQDIHYTLVRIIRRLLCHSKLIDNEPLFWLYVEIGNNGNSMMNYKTIVSTAIIFLLNCELLTLANAAEAAAISSIWVLIYAMKATDSTYQVMNESLKLAYAAVDAAPIWKLWSEKLVTLILTCEGASHKWETSWTLLSGEPS